MADQDIEQVVDAYTEPSVCMYSATHRARKVPAVTYIDCGRVVGIVPACRSCADMYARLSKRS